MTKRRSIIAAFLVVALLAVGIGYAALTDDLTVTGSASIKASDSAETFDGDIYFSKALGDATRVEATILADNDKAVMNVLAGTLKQVGDEVIATYTIKSESDLDVVITPSIAANPADPLYTLNDEYFSVYTNLTGDQTLKAGETIDFTITVKLIKTNATNDDVSCNFVVTFDVQTK